MPGYAWTPSGGFRVVYEHANRLVSRGHQVVVVHPRHLEFYEAPRPSTARGRLRNAKFALMEFVARPSIHWQFIDKRVSLLFVPSSDKRYIPNSDVLFATAWNTVRPVMEYPIEKGEKCYFIQGLETWMGPADLVQSTWRTPIKKAVVSRWLFDVGRLLGADELTYIPNAIDHSLFRVIRPISQRVRQVVMACSSVSTKRIQDGIEALKIAKMKFPDLNVVLFGAGRRPASIPKWMSYARNPPQEDIVKEFYNNSSIVLSSSVSEGFALPPAEGAACGCSIVATDSGGIRDFAEHDVTALLSPGGRPEALAKNLCLLLADDNLRIRLARAANDRIKQFTWERASRLLEDFITCSGQQFRDRHSASIPKASDLGVGVPSSKNPISAYNPVAAGNE